jgi:hypothetical protein
VSGVTTPADFSLTNVTGAAGSIIVISGDGQSAAVNTAFGAPLVVEVRDGGSNPVAGVSVGFAAPGSGASATVIGAPATTGADGRASVLATANNTVGSYTVTASAGSLSTGFTLTNTAVGTVPLAVNAACVGNNLRITIVGGDANFDITGTGAMLPQSGVAAGTYTLTGPASWTGVTVTELTGDLQTNVIGAMTCPSVVPPTVVTTPAPRIGIVVPNNGLAMITLAQRQTFYFAPNSDVVRDSYGNPMMLPVDADGNGFDTYTVTEIRIVNDQIWLALFLGSPAWAWVPIDNTTPLTVLPIPEQK